MLSFGSTLHYFNYLDKIEITKNVWKTEIMLYICRVEQKPMETKRFKEPKQRLKDGRYCSDEQKRIEMSIDRCKLLEMQLQTERRKVIALTERNVQIEKKYNDLKQKIREFL